MAHKKLVIGASGFLGSHVARRLIEDGEDVRVLIRTTSSTRGIDDLDVERCYGDIFDAESVRAAIRGCDVVYYCVVDARAWLSDPTPLWRTNVDGLRQVLDVLVDSAEGDLRKFVFTSSIATIGIAESGCATETQPHNWLDVGGDYVHTRVLAEQMVLRYARERGLPAVAMCVANTYGAGDWLPTPHGGLVAAAVRGRLPFYVKGAAAECVGIADAAQALVLAAERGRVGERYIVSERFLTAREIYQTACAAVNVPPPKRGVPIRLLSAVGSVVAPLARLRGRNSQLSPLTVRLMHVMSPMDHSKAVRELGWRPRPVTDAIVEAAHFFRSRRRTA